MSASAIAVLEQRLHEDTSLTTAPAVHDSADDPVVVYLARFPSTKSRATMRAAWVVASVVCADRCPP